MTVLAVIPRHYARNRVAAAKAVVTMALVETPNADDLPLMIDVYPSRGRPRVNRRPSAETPERISVLTKAEVG